MQFYKLITILIITCSLLITGCSDSALDTPLDGSNQDTFNQSLLDIQSSLSDDDFEELKWAVGYLKIHTIENTSVDSFYSSLDQATPDDIIKQARALEIKLKNN